MKDELENRKKLFLKYITNLELKSVFKECSVTEFYCPCCNYPTLPERGTYHICPLCSWEDDGQDEPFEDEVWGGPNGDYSLSEARNNFARFFTCYRPEDKNKFDSDTEKTHLKKLLIEKYKVLFTLKEKSLCEKLKNEIKKIIGQLL